MESKIDRRHFNPGRPRNSDEKRRDNRINLRLTDKEMEFISMMADCYDISKPKVVEKIIQKSIKNSPIL